jgi:hypothetical protein
LKQITRLPGYQDETMKTLITKINPAFKMNQPLPLLPGHFPNPGGGDVAGAARSFPTQRKTPRTTISLAACAMAAKHELSAAILPLMN